MYTYDKMRGYFIKTRNIIGLKIKDYDKKYYYN